MVATTVTSNGFIKMYEGLHSLEVKFYLHTLSMDTSLYYYYNILDYL